MREYSAYSIENEIEERGEKEDGYERSRRIADEERKVATKLRIKAYSGIFTLPVFAV